DQASHPPGGIRPPADHGINRPDLHAPQGVQGTGTNRPKTYTQPRNHNIHNTQTTAPHHQITPPPTKGGTTEKVNRGTAVHSDRETPGPIPNPEAKPASADD